MTTQNWITLVIAILGVLHGPLIPWLLSRHNKNTSTK